MGKYSKYQRKSPPRREMSPIWRGIGCLLIIIVPAVAYGLTYLVLQETKRLNWVPAELLGYIQFPKWVWGLPVLDPVARFLGSLQDVWAFLILYIVLLLILIGLISLAYSLIYKIIGPPRYSELDAPPANKKAKDYTR